jgi:hypothetical protein
MQHPLRGVKGDTRQHCQSCMRRSYQRRCPPRPASRPLTTNGRSTCPHEARLPSTWQRPRRPGNVLLTRTERRRHRGGGRDDRRIANIVAVRDPPGRGSIECMVRPGSARMMWLTLPSARMYPASHDVSSVKGFFCNPRRCSRCRRLPCEPHIRREHFPDHCPSFGTGELQENDTTL